MDYRKLIEELKKYTYWLGRDEPCSHDIHPVICDEAAAAIEALLAERDAAVEDLRGSCWCCTHKNICMFGNHMRDICVNGSEWEWRGPAKGDAQ